MGDRGRWVLWTGAIAGCPLALVVLYAIRGLLFLILVAFVLAYGVWGILFAVPTVAILQVLLPELWGLVQQRQVHAE